MFTLTEVQGLANNDANAAAAAAPAAAAAVGQKNRSSSSLKKRVAPSASASAFHDASSHIDGNDFLDRMVRVPNFSCQYPKLTAATMLNDLRVCESDKTKAQIILAVRNAFRLMPAAMLETDVIQDLAQQLNSRSKLCRACAAAALSSMTALPQARGNLMSRRDVLERLVAMLRCGIHSMDATTASLVLANSCLHPGMRDRLSKPKVILLLVSLVRQAVSSPVVDESESDHNHLLDMMGMERPLVTRILPKPAALNAAAALCHMASSEGARDIMTQVGLMEVLFDAHHGLHQNPLKERCKMLLNLLLIHRMDAVPFVNKWYETCKHKSVKTMVKDLGLEDDALDQKPLNRHPSSLPSIDPAKPKPNSSVELHRADESGRDFRKNASIYDLVYG